MGGKGAFFLMSLLVVVVVVFLNIFICLSALIGVLSSSVSVRARSLEPGATDNCKWVP